MNKRALLIVAVALLGAALAVASVWASADRWSTRLRGEFELPMAVDTKAKGQAKFKLNEAGDVLSYKLKVSNIQNVFMAHIHMAPPTSNGPVVVWLYPSAPNPPAPQPPASWRPGRTSGPLAEGEIRASDLVGPLAGQTLADLVALMNSGNAYVNVHTNDFQGASNTGPGDMSSGEIRGNLSAHADHENGEDEDEDDDDGGQGAHSK